MASGWQELRASSKESDMGNRRHSLTSSDMVPVSGVNIPFEELLARELRKSQGNGSTSVAITDNKTSKKSFLKKGARGWWMRQPDAKKKLVKHLLKSNDEIEIKTIPLMQRRHRDRRLMSVASADSVSSSPEQGQTVENASQTLSPLASPIQWTQYSYEDDDEVQHLMAPNDNFRVWKNASLRSTTSTDIMGMQNVRQSYEANQEREANDMAVFEAIERDLAAEKQAFLMEKQLQQQDKPVEQREQIDCDNQSGANHCELPYSSFVSDLHEQEELRRQTTRRGLSFDVSQDGEIDSALVFDDYSALLKDDEVSEQDGSTCQLREHLDYGNCCGDRRSDLSLSSFDDFVAWNDGISLQSRQSVVHTQSSNIAAAGLNVSPSKQDRLTGEGVRQQANKRELYFAECIGDGANALEHNKLGTPEFMPEGNASVSFLVRHVFGEFEQDENSNSVSLYHEDDMYSDGDHGIHTACRDPSLPPPPPVQDRSSSNRTQKLRTQQQPSVTRLSSTNAKADDKQTRQEKVKIAASSSIPGTKSSKETLTPSRDQSAQLADADMILPAVIEEKLYELEAEVMLYKSAMLQFQKQKTYYDQEAKKLALERDEFKRFQQEQRLLIEKEWERQRTKMKKEAKLQERQWKLRMNATISHQDRKDHGETEMLKAQIVKMRTDEDARASRWKAGNDNVRRRVLELEEKNRDLADEIKFLKKERLEQCEQYERLLKKTQEAFGLASKSGVTSTVPSVLSEKNELRISDDVCAMKGTADELLQKWNYPRKRPPNTHDKNDATAGSTFQNYVQSNAVGSSNPKRYSYGRDNLHPLSKSGTLTGVNALDRLSEQDVDIASDAEYARASNAAATYERALPAVEDVEISTNIGNQKSNNCEDDGTITSLTSSQLEHKVVTKEIDHAGGKKELLYTDGSRKILFPDGNEKDIDVHGHAVIIFTNGDYKELFPDTGIIVYYYYEAQTKLTTYPDKRKVYEFPNRQVETSLPDGTIEIEFPDGIKKTICPNGDEFSVFPDGTTMLEQPSGLREVTLLNQKKIRYFADGQMTCVSLSGQETRIRSDSELNKQLIENT